MPCVAVPYYVQYYLGFAKLQHLVIQKTPICTEHLHLIHRPRALTRYSETQGEKAYKAGDPRSRASSSASESRTPSLKVETPSQGSGLANQTSPTDSMTPRTSGSGESSITASSFNTITTNFQAVNFSPGPGSSNKRSASQAQLSETHAYQPMSPGPGSRPSGNYGQMTNQNTYTRAAQSQFDEVYSEAGNAQFSGYGTTPQLPLLRIPEETYTPGLSYTQDNSPWCSSASDSTYSTQSDGPRNISQWTHRGRSASIPDWPVTTTHWSPNPASVTSQDIRAPPFESILEQYDTPYMSPRMTPPSRSHQLLDVPGTSFGGIYVESVGTPALSTYIKPLAQSFPASAPRMSDSGLASAARRPKEMLLELFTIDTTTMSMSGAQPQLDVYLSSYWKFFHPLFPIIHRPTFEHAEDDLLRIAIAAIGTQYHDTPEARTKGSELNEACKKGIDLVSLPFLITRIAFDVVAPVFSSRTGAKYPSTRSSKLWKLEAKPISDVTARQSLIKHPPRFVRHEYWLTNHLLVSQLEHQYHASNTPYRIFHALQRSKNYCSIVEAF